MGIKIEANCRAGAPAAVSRREDEARAATPDEPAAPTPVT